MDLTFLGQDSLALSCEYSSGIMTSNNNNNNNNKIVAAQDQAISTNYFKNKILKEEIEC